MKITQVERQKKNTKRFNIFLDGKFAFGADEDTVVNFRLLKDKEISTEDLEKILFETEVGKLIDRVYGLLSRRLRSEKEIRDYLRTLSFKRKANDKEELSEVVIESLIDRLKHRDLVNDSRFALEWVESRGKKRGVQVLKGELMRKGISREIIDQVLINRLKTVDEGSIAELALDRKMKSFSNLDEFAFKKKATEFLLRRGFNYETVKTVVEKFLKKRYNDS